MINCTSCGHALDPTNKFCGGCGTPVITVPSACASCGANFQSTDKFCGSCGASRLAPAPDPNCSNCGALLKKENKFCPECATPRTEKATTAKSNYPTMVASGGLKSHDQTDLLHPWRTSNVAAVTSSGSPTVAVSSNSNSQSLQVAADASSEVVQPVRLPSGTRDQSKPYKILVLGQTGSGKTTFINVLCNYMRGGSLRKLKVLIPTQFLVPTEVEGTHNTENDPTDTTKAQTTKCTRYDFRHPDGAYFEVIDTPGLADTKGVKQDDANISEILNFCAKLDYLDCIAIVVNGTYARFDVCMRTVLQRFRGNLPDTVLNSVAVVFTNCTKLTRNFKIEVIESNLLPLNTKLNPNNIFYFQNTFFSSDPKSWTPRDIQDELQPLWDKSMRTMSEFLVHVSHSSPTSTKDFAIMRDSRDMLKAKMADVLSEIGKLDKLRQNIEQAKILQSKAQADRDLYKDYIVQKEMTEYSQEDTISHNTNCMVHQVTCHEQCGLQELPQKGDPGFKSCACFGGGPSCRVCEKVSNGQTCGSENHYHINKKWVMKKTTVQETLEDMKSKYDECVQEEAKQGNAMAQAEADLKTLENVLDTLMRDITGLCEQLTQIASGFNLAAELGAIIQHWEWELSVMTDLNTRQQLETRMTYVKDLITKLSGGKVYTSKGSTDTEQTKKEGNGSLLSRVMNKFTT